MEKEITCDALVLMESQSRNPEDGEINQSGFSQFSFLCWYLWNGSVLTFLHFLNMMTYAKGMYVSDNAY